MEPTHIDEGVLNLVLTGVPGVVGVHVGSTIRTSDHSIVFIEVVLEQSIPHLVCRQKVFLKNSVDWEMIRRHVKGLNCNRILRFLCPVSLRNEALFCVLLGIEFPAGRLCSEREISLDSMIRESWLTMRSREHIECKVVV